MKNIETYESFSEKTLNETNQELLDKASKLIGKELDDKSLIPELRDSIEISLQNGDNNRADELTDIKLEIEKINK